MGRRLSKPRPDLLLQIVQLVCGQGDRTPCSDPQGCSTACGLCNLHMHRAAVQRVQRPLKGALTFPSLATPFKTSGTPQG